MNHGGRRRRIIVVDDDSSVLQTVTRQLHSLGWEVHPARAAGEALSMLCSLGHVDALLSDVDMPIMDGVSLQKEVVNRFPDTTVILMSGDHDTAVLRKPFTVQTLALALQTMCKDRQ